MLVADLVWQRPAMAVVRADRAEAAEAVDGRVRAAVVVDMVDSRAEVQAAVAADTVDSRAAVPVLAVVADTADRAELAAAAAAVDMADSRAGRMRAAECRKVAFDRAEVAVVLRRDRRPLRADHQLRFCRTRT